MLSGEVLAEGEGFEEVKENASNAKGKGKGKAQQQPVSEGDPQSKNVDGEVGGREKAEKGKRQTKPKPKPKPKLKRKHAAPETQPGDKAPSGSSQNLQGETTDGGNTDGDPRADATTDGGYTDADAGTDRANASTGHTSDASMITPHESGNVVTYSAFSPFSIPLFAR